MTRPAGVTRGQWVGYAGCALVLPGIVTGWMPLYVAGCALVLVALVALWVEATGPLREQRRVARLAEHYDTTDTSEHIDAGTWEGVDDHESRHRT